MDRSAADIQDITVEEGLELQWAQSAETLQEMVGLYAATKAPGCEADSFTVRLDVHNNFFSGRASFVTRACDGTPSDICISILWSFRYRHE